MQKRSPSKKTGFTKITAGFVCQRYQPNQSGHCVCIHQEFIAGDEVQYENAQGDPINPPDHAYQPFNMTLSSRLQIADSLCAAMEQLRTRGTIEAGIRTLKTLLKQLG